MIKQLISSTLLLQPSVTRKTGSYILIITLYKKGNHYQRAKIKVIFWNQFQLQLPTYLKKKKEKKAIGKALAVFRNKYRKFYVTGLTLKLWFCEKSQKNIRSWTLQQNQKVFCQFKSILFLQKIKLFLTFLLNSNAKYTRWNSKFSIIIHSNTVC